jgi:hypothetical protein
MNKTIIFMGGIFIPNWLAKSKFVWDESHWNDYKCIWLESKIPYSDTMVERELDRLQRLLNRYPGATLAGHSLGAWWASNLACRPNCDITKTVLWTPLVDHEPYPIFNVTPRYNPCKQTPNPNNIGPKKVLVVYGDEDLIVPHQHHAYHGVMHFRASPYLLAGGHLYQKNHKEALVYMKQWIETR